jgi:hypothetical protein
MVALIAPLAFLSPALAQHAETFHVPVMDTSAGKDLNIWLSSKAMEEIGQTELFYRKLGEKSWRSLGFGLKAEDTYLAVVPGKEITTPGLEYYIVSKKSGQTTERFASASMPHIVSVIGDSRESDMERELERYGGKRSKATARYRYDNFGSQKGIEDTMWSGQVDFTYRMLTQLRSLRFGMARMRADGIIYGLPAEDLQESGDAVSMTAQQTGYDYGFAELELALHDYFGVMAQVQLGANLTRFTAGAEGTVRIGLDPGTHVDITAGFAGDIGAYGGLYLTWDTVPRVLMTAGGDVTTFPNTEKPAIQLRYIAEVPVNDGLAVQIQTSYQARTAVYGGMGGGLGMSYSF